MGSKLPSNSDVLKTLFYNLRLRKLLLRESAALVNEEVLLFWKKARIPSRNTDKVQENIKKSFMKIGKTYKRTARSKAI